MKKLERLLNLYLAKNLEKISHVIAKKSLLPASIFTKKQIEKIDENFRRFWEEKKVSSYFKSSKKPRFLRLHLELLTLYGNTTLIQMKNKQSFYQSFPSITFKLKQRIK